MTDKVQKIREEVARIHNLLPVMDSDNISVNYADRICTTLEMYIDSLQEEPVSKTPTDIEAAMQEVEEKSRVFTEAHKRENADDILAQMRGEEPVSIWHDASKKYPLTGKEIIVLRDDKIYYGKYIGGLHRYVRAEIQLTDDTAQTYVIIDHLTKKDKWIYVEDLLNLSNVERTFKLNK